MIARFLLSLTLIVPSLADAAQSERQPAQGRPGARGRQTPQQAEPEMEVRVFQLVHSSVDDIAAIVGQILKIQVVPDNRTKSIIVAASAAEVQRVAELVQKLDMPADAAGSSQDVSVVAVANRDVNDLAGRISDLYRGELRISADPTGRRLLLRGDTAEIDTARALVKQLDTPTPTASIEFAFLHIGAADDAATSDIPADLEPVARQIERFGTPRLMGRLMTVAMEGEEFAVTGEIAKQSEVEIKGRLLSAPENGATKLDVRAELQLNKLVSAGTKDEHTLAAMFRLATSVVVKRGDYVVLGSAPHGVEPGESVVLVVHVPGAP